MCLTPNESFTRCFWFIKASSSLTSNNKLVSCWSSLHYSRAQNNSVSRLHSHFQICFLLWLMLCNMRKKKNGSRGCFINADLLFCFYAAFPDRRDKGKLRRCRTCNGPKYQMIFPPPDILFSSTSSPTAPGGWLMIGGSRSVVCGGSQQAAEVWSLCSQLD